MIMLNMRLMVIKIETYRQTNICTKLNLFFSNILTDIQNSSTRKIHLPIAINFISSEDAEEERVNHSSVSNIKFISYNDISKVDDLFDPLLSRCQGNLQILMTGSDFIFDLLTYYRCHKVNFRLGGSYIDFAEWVKKKISNTKSKKRRR